ncbi:MAG: metal-dependent hydrolase [Luminiphilus sp.]
MDPLSQATLGAAAAQSLIKKSDLARIALIGALAGMAPDLDVLIQSSTDPLLQLEYHRQFTHSLIFIPVGALLCAIAFWPFMRRHMSFKAIWLTALAGYATHALLDACTTYGTLLLWPFSDARIAWNTISVVDPVFTLPLLGFVIAAGVKKSQFIGRLGMAWVAFYLSIGVIQEERAIAAGEALAADRGHAPDVVSAKPSFGNLLLWKTVYEYDDHFWVDAVRAGGDVTIIEGDHVARLNLQSSFPWLDTDSQQARDVERFRWFSNDYLAIDSDDAFLIVDMRYSHLPNEIKGLWGIRLDPDASADEHVTWIARRSADSERFEQLWAMLKGN